MQKRPSRETTVKRNGEKARRVETRGREVEGEVESHRYGPLYRPGIDEDADDLYERARSSDREAKSQHAKSLHEDLAKILKTDDQNFLLVLTQQLMDAGEGFYSGLGLIFITSFLQIQTPRDHLETTLIVQMAFTHLFSMRLASQLSSNEDILEDPTKQEACARLLGSFNRTFAAQLSALKRYRSGGEQRVTVRHVTVSEGGQAIVGPVIQMKGSAPESRESRRPALVDSREAPMEMISEPKREPIRRRGGEKP